MPFALRLRHVRGLATIAVLGATLLVPETAAAHFTLVSPPAMTEQDILGNPQKAPPCGDNGMAVMTGIVTGVSPGDTLTITIEETIYHPGHYRIAIAGDPSELPEPPPVTPGSTPCGSAPIDPAPALPVIADGVFEHTEPFANPQQSIDIVMPEGLSCETCTLQVIQFMSNHALNDPGGCYYHHCATLEVGGDVSPTGGDETGPEMTSGDPTSTSNGGTTADNGDSDGVTEGGSDPDTGSQTSAPTTSAGSDDGAGADDEDASGCSCSQHESGAPVATLLGLLGLLGLRARRRGVTR